MISSTITDGGIDSFGFCSDGDVVASCGNADSGIPDVVDETTDVDDDAKFPMLGDFVADGIWPIVPISIGGDGLGISR